MLILGLDPGTATTGYALLRSLDDVHEVVDFGLIETDKNGTPSIRLFDIYEKMKAILEKFQPDIVVIERLFFATNTKTAMRVGQAQGVMLFCAGQFQKEVFEYAPGTIKKTITGDGRADKKLVQSSLRKVLGVGIRSRPHKKTHFDNAADALAVALCHVLQSKPLSEKEEVGVDAV